MYTVAACLKQAGYVAITQVAHARVPVVKLVDPRAGKHNRDAKPYTLHTAACTVHWSGNSWTADGSISCDVCINNVMGVANSALLREYAL